MPRYIDADWILQNLDRWRERLAETYGENDEYVLCLEEVLMKLDSTPTADVVEVVRCKDCEHHKNAPQTTDVWCERLDGLLPKDWFCGDGERGEDV